MNNIMTINGVAKKLGIAPETIRKWEETGKVKKAKRNKRGWRIYSKTDAEEIMAFHLVKSHL